MEAPSAGWIRETGVVTDEVVYICPPMWRDEFIVAQANEPLDENGRFARARVNARYRSEFLEIEPDKVDYMDVSRRWSSRWPRR